MAHEAASSCAGRIAKMLRRVGAAEAQEHYHRHTSGVSNLLREAEYARNPTETLWVLPLLTSGTQRRRHDHSAF